MIFTGAFTAKVRPDYLLSLMAEMGSAVHVDVRTSDLWVKRLGAEFAFRNGESSVGPWVDASELLALYEANDVLLSIAEVDGSQMSSKIFSYMATGKPIVHIYYANNDVNMRYLQDYPLALCVKADGALVVKNAQLIELFLLWTSGRRASAEEVEARFAKCTPVYVANLLVGFGETAPTGESQSV